MNRLGKLIKYISTTPLIVGILLLKDLRELYIEVVRPFLSYPFSQVSFQVPQFDYFDFGIKVVMAVSLWLLLKEYYKLSRYVKEQAIVNKFLSLKIDTDMLFNPDNTPVIDTLIHRVFSKEEVKTLIKLGYVKVETEVVS